MNDWIKMRKDLTTDPAVAQIAQQCRLSELHVVGALYVVWCWADTNTCDGVVWGATGALVDKIAGRKGFAAAMASEGVEWLELDYLDGASGRRGVRFPKWERHNSASAKARAGESERKRLERSGTLRGSVGAPSVPPRGDLSGQKADKCPDNVRKKGGQVSGQCPDQRREEKNNILCVCGNSEGEAAMDDQSGAEAPEKTHTHEALAAWKERLAAQYPGIEISAEIRRATAYVQRTRGKTAPLSRTFFEGEWLPRVPSEGGTATSATVEAVSSSRPEPEGWRETDRYRDSRYGPGGESYTDRWTCLPEHAQAAIAEDISKKVNGVNPPHKVAEV